MYKLLAILICLINNYKCYKIKNWKNYCEPFHLNYLVKKSKVSYKSNKFTNSFFSLRNNVREENESNIYDKSYVYHTPVLLSEVIQYINNKEECNKLNECINNSDKIELKLNSSPSNKNITNLNINKRCIDKEKCFLYESKDLKGMEKKNLRNYDSIKSFHISKEQKNTNGGEENNYYIDATLGGGGHTLEILKKIENSKVIAIDKDIESIYYNKLKLKNYIDKNRLFLIHGDYRNILHLLNYNSLPLSNYSGILIDLGVSSHQLKSIRRGFSYKYNGILDMNMNKYTEEEFVNSYFSNKNYSTISNNSDNINNKIHNILNTYSLKKLKFIIETFGEEKKALKIAKKIVQWRKNNGKIVTTYDLKHIVLLTCKKNYKSNNKVLSRVFQSFRIYINDELKALKEFLISAHKILKPTKRLITISYHSLEHMCIEKFVERKKKLWIKINKNAITPSENEIKLNNSSRSAKMFVFEKRKY
ncbi:S-adenosyl-methyltransferase, putative [Plasmodium gallinaceum]|uniref:S-adenosyl-methyltransferase, putative n=1 Tax=Plasmodium gallinaceum TaxID=5849 RepID=A0A1J1GX35_PLAGA|nr:S-adenosyl-methyltransferase, putative [Plasmodium gallinaceum]CRG97004.1 S-adenosyl-methyltransferase, putative [Plasmodium gallinaceum]